MAVAAEGPIASMKTILSNSGAFQTWTGAVNAAAALAFIHLWEVTDDNATRPFCLIDIPSRDATRRSKDVRNHFSGTVKLMLRFEQAVPVGDVADPASAFNGLMNATEGDTPSIRDDILGHDGDNSGGVFLDITSFDRGDDDGPHRVSEKERKAGGDDYIQVDYWATIGGLP